MYTSKQFDKNLLYFRIFKHTSCKIPTINIYLDIHITLNFDIIQFFASLLISWICFVSVPWVTLRISCRSSSWVAQLCYRNFNVHGCSTLCTMSCPADNYWLANFWFNSFKRDYWNRVYSIGKQFSMDINHDIY